MLLAGRLALALVPEASLPNPLLHPLPLSPPLRREAAQAGARSLMPSPPPLSWRLGFAQQSPVDQLLETGDFTLNQLLDEDDLIQECKQLNKKLVEL
jgi:hypothetical protein